MTSVDDFAEALDGGIIIETWFTRAAFCTFVNDGSLDGD